MFTTTTAQEDEMAQNPLDCPIGDWPNDGSKDTNEQIALLLGHLNDVHGQDLPPEVRAGIDACKKAIEELNLSV